MAEAYCGVADCDRRAARGGLCWLHYDRRRAGRPLAAPVDEVRSAAARREQTDPKLRLLDALRAYDDAETERESRSADERIRRAVAAMATLLFIRRGWKPPRRKP